MPTQKRLGKGSFLSPAGSPRYSYHFFPGAYTDSGQQGARSMRLVQSHARKRQEQGQNLSSVLAMSLIFLSASRCILKEVSAQWMWLALHIWRVTLLITRACRSKHVASIRCPTEGAEVSRFARLPLSGAFSRPAADKRAPPCFASRCACLSKDDAPRAVC